MKQFAAILYLLIAAHAAPLVAHNECVSLCGTVPYPSNTGHVTPDPILESPKVWSFVSEPQLHPMKVKVKTYKKGTSPGFIFVAPYAFSDDAIYGQPGALILDNDANPVWFRPLSSPNLMNTDFRMQRLYGKPVLTFWQGTLATPPTYTNLPPATSEPGSCYYILDQTYRVIHNVVAKKGYTSDIHEFLLTPNNTALLLATKAVPMDLTPFGGPQNGYIQDFSIQEIDLKTNKLLFFWNALDHIPLTDSYEPASSATSSNNIWDVYHFNSIGLTDDENDILVSSRNTWTIYRINKPSKMIVWRLGGKQSSFTIESDAEFSWQHDARFLPKNLISLFDDNCCESSTIPPGTPPARGLVLKLNLNNMTAKLHRTYYHDPNLQIGSQGNVQSLENGNKFIGWGESQYFSEYKKRGNTVEDPAVNTLYNAKMPGNNYTYRAYKDHWVGIPFYPPSIALKSSGEKTTVFASWNGSTETASWRVFGGRHPNFLSKIKSSRKKGFETAIEICSYHRYYQVKAVDAHGKVIGTSEIVKSGN